MATRVGQVLDYKPDITITYGNLKGLASLGALDKEQLIRFQRELIRLGYPIKGGADGLMGSSTRSATKMVQTKINEFYKASKVPVDGTPSMEVFREMDSGNNALRATDADKKALSGGTGSSSSGLLTTGGGATSGGTTGTKKEEEVVEQTIMQKYAAWLQDKPIPDFLKNPYVASGAIVVTAAALFFGVRALTKSEPAPAMAGLGEDALDAMKKAMRPQPKRKKRRKSRKSKK